MPMESFNHYYEEKKIENNGDNGIFEKLNDANMKKWYERYKITESWTIIWNFFKSVSGKVQFQTAKNWYDLNDSVIWMPWPYFDTQWWFDAYAKVNWNVVNQQHKKYGFDKEKRPEVNDSGFLVINNWVLSIECDFEKAKWDTVLEMVQVMKDWLQSGSYFGRNTILKRWYRFVVVMNDGSSWVIDFKQPVSVTDAVKTMWKNGVKSALLADLMQWDIYFTDTQKTTYVREDQPWSNGAVKNYYKAWIQPKLWTHNMLVFK